MTELADRAGLSRQTLYAFLNDERSEFGAVAQIRLSRIINQISTSPDLCKSRLLSISMTSKGPVIRFPGR